MKTDEALDNAANTPPSIWPLIVVIVTLSLTNVLTEIRAQNWKEAARTWKETYYMSEKTTAVLSSQLKDSHDQTREAIGLAEAWQSRALSKNQSTHEKQ